MTRRVNQVGFSQRVQLDWLERTASLVLAGNDKSAVNDALQELLKDKVSVGGKAKRGNREKIITILLKIWLNVQRELDALRLDGLEHLKRHPQTDRITAHWGMVMAVYPFWADVANHTGRLLKLQNNVVAAHIQRRIREQYGERETVSRAARRVLRSFLDWGVLHETDTKGIYKRGLSLTVDDPKLVSWLIEASLHAGSNGSAAIKDLIENPSLFPFQIMSVSAENMVFLSPRLDMLRHGLDDNLIILKKNHYRKSET